MVIMVMQDFYHQPYLPKLKPSTKKSLGSLTRYYSGWDFGVHNATVYSFTGAIGRQAMNRKENEGPNPTSKGHRHGDRVYIPAEHQHQHSLST